MKKILIVNPFGIGDVLFSTPLIAALKAQDPSVSISYIGNARTLPFLKNDPRLDHVFSYERDEFVAVYKQSPWQFLLKWKKFVEDIRAEGFDTAYDLSNGSPVSVALMLAGIPQRIGFDYKGRGRWLTQKMPLKGYEGRHVAEYILDLMRVAGQDPMTEHGMSLYVGKPEEFWAQDFMRSHGLLAKGFIMLFPGGGASWGKGADLKRWPAQGYAKLAEKIIERSKCPIILMGDKSEEGLCKAVIPQGNALVIILAGQTSVLQSAALMRQARCVVVNDGGPLHMAVACGASTVSIFGPVDPAVYGPYPASDKHKVVVKGLACQPCYRKFRMSGCGHQRCLKDLTVDDVLETMKEFLV
ncbi:MAG: lipopolysaccharide heptosyltransferase II [Candidatus Omnitrophica bacterium]|nr:lipopolysaccharide heptosyltransferase II [Candidatus Omnitrophota bacterium]